VGLGAGARLRAGPALRGAGLAGEEEQTVEFTKSEATLELRRSGEAVRIRASYADGEADVPWSMLSDEADRFLMRVADDLRAEPSPFRDPRRPSAWEGSVSRVHATAVLDLTATSAGGLAGSIESGTRSLLLRFPSGDAEVQVGAAISTADGTPLTPGASQAVALEFWADEAAEVVRPGLPFVAWHGRDVGSGTVTAVG
jgi:hypothetical protein